MALFSWLCESRIVDYTASSVVVTVVALIVGIYKLQTRIIYIPNFPPGSRSVVWRPDKVGFSSWKEVKFPSLDGTILHAYWIPHSNYNKETAEADTKEIIPTIIYFHANAGNMGHRLPIAKRITDFSNVNIFMLSYRGYGESEGSADEEGIRMDSQATLEYILNELGDQINPNKVILYGQSIGGAVAIDLAARNQEKVKAVIVENTFRSLNSLIPHVMPYLSWASPLCHQKWDSEGRLRDIGKGRSLPHMLFLSGAADELIPPSHMKYLYHLINKIDSSKDKTVFKSFEKGTHNDTFFQPGYFEAIADFISNI